jgi:nitrite reductase/ring-hydroxylating ferredoxin subunit
MVLKKLCDLKDFPTEGRAVFKVDDTEILVFLVEDNFYAINKKCTHMGGNLAKGKLEGKTIKCPLHGAIYNIESGELIQQVGKIAGLLKKAKNIQTYRIIQQEDAIWVEI